MNYKKSKLFIILWLFSGFSGLLAQESMNASGGNANGSGGSSSYSVGQCFYQTVTGTSGSVAAGVQHPYEVITVSAIDDTEFIQLLVTAYPNPATNILNIEVNSFDLSKLSYGLYNASGTLLQNGEIIRKHTEIDLRSKTAGAYFLKIIREKSEIKTFKIIKK